MEATSEPNEIRLELATLATIRSIPGLPVRIESSTIKTTYLVAKRVLSVNDSPDEFRQIEFRASCPPSSQILYVKVAELAPVLGLSTQQVNALSPTELTRLVQDRTPRMFATIKKMHSILTNTLRPNIPLNGLHPVNRAISFIARRSTPAQLEASLAGLATRDTAKKNKIYQTLFSIGEVLVTWNGQNIYQENTATGNYFLSQDGIFIQDEHIDSGTSKSVSKAIVLGNPQDLVWIDVSRNLQATWNEAGLIDSLHRNRVPNITPAYHPTRHVVRSIVTLKDGRTVVRGKKIIMFQPRSVGTLESLLQKKIPIVPNQSSPTSTPLVPNTPGRMENMLQVSCDIAAALAGLHKSGRVHCDLKPANILLNREPNGRLRGLLHDFGMSTEVNQPIHGGSRISLPPENIDRLPNGKWDSVNPATPATDSFGLGATLIYSITGKRSHSYDGNKYYFSDLARGTVQGLPTLDQFIDNEINSIRRDRTMSPREKAIACNILALCKELMKLDPTKRISCGDALILLKVIQEESLKITP